MDTVSASEAARRLCTSVPRVKRAVARLGLAVEQQRGGRVLLTERQLAELRDELGIVVAVAGLTRVETQALAALARSPRGLASARAVARRAGLSPTAAAAAIRSLTLRDLVRRERVWVPAGRARHVEFLHANVTARDWSTVAPGLASVRVRREPRRPLSSSRVPARLRHLFWNADVSRLDAGTHGAYIAERLLSTIDLDGLAWGLQALNAADWEQASRVRGLPAARRALALNLAASTGS